ncbi:hypothetical protein FA95DRAFT_1577978 [Auriscalpium vulgare]|uniref:Uncharacterized protein n=1 Tax=Auriscalpium vulgare TaxID=40419 RepID=A0ACB8R418_9AGAM|nr:hypothetical protein FA95DRAFT_1577978 [Auriscalpium vulgare]
MRITIDINADEVEAVARALSFANIADPHGPSVLGAIPLAAHRLAAPPAVFAPTASTTSPPPHPTMPVAAPSIPNQRAWAVIRGRLPGVHLSEAAKDLAIEGVENPEWILLNSIGAAQRYFAAADAAGRVAKVDIAPPTPTRPACATSSTRSTSSVTSSDSDTPARGIKAKGGNNNKNVAWVVVEGLKPGLYDSWEEAARQHAGPGASGALRGNTQPTTRSTAYAALSPLRVLLSCLPSPPSLLLSPANPSTPELLTMAKKVKGAPRGPKTWASGTKWTFLASRRDEYLQAKEVNTTGAFYDNLVHLWLLKYGYDLPINEDIAADVPDPTDEDLANAKAAGDSDVGEEEQARRDALRAELKIKLGNWYRHHCSKVVKEEDRHDDWAKKLLQSAVNPPKRAQAYHYYSRKYFDTRVKPAFLAGWEEKQADARAAGLPKLNDKQKFAYQGNVTRQKYQFESQEFKEELARHVEEEYQAALAEYNQRYIDQPQTAEQYGIALNSAYSVLQPLVDLISHRYGMVAAIYIAGPSPHKNGAIGAYTRVQSGKTIGVHQQTWPEFDPKAHEQFSASFMKFAGQCFTADMCKSRALRTAESAESDAHSRAESPPPSSSSTLPASTSSPSPEPESSDFTSPEPSPLSAAPAVVQATSSTGLTSTAAANSATSVSTASAHFPAAPAIPARAPSPLLPTVSFTPLASNTSSSTYALPPLVVGARPDPTASISTVSDAEIDPQLFDQNEAASTVSTAPTSPPAATTLVTHASPATAEAPDRRHGRLLGGHGPFVFPPSMFDYTPPQPTDPSTDASAHAQSSVINVSEAVARDGTSIHKSGYQFLKALEFGPEWDALVEEYFRFEAMHGFKEDGGRLASSTSTNKRPKEIGHWVRCARPWTHKAVDPVNFGIQWWIWFKALVPSGQLTSAGRVVRLDGTDWSLFERPGHNGLLNLVIGFAWWGAELRMRDGMPRSMHQSFNHALEDVRWILQALCAKGCDEPNRQSDSADENDDETEERSTTSSGKRAASKAGGRKSAKRRRG